MTYIVIEESDRLDWALKKFKREMIRSGLLADLRKKRFYVKPSEARQRKSAAARRRNARSNRKEG
ncbi:MAG: 30S ribosomal protein S21 [Gemmatimonadaceae bacterium]|nr:30S ribosomal protein S21 [Gemmatimonadaceae bacterium]MBC7790196.1 30S ribosomal protein S21 [Gemmatimonadaceae bacterium]MDQ3519198.1 30S ribosomal protein S21 [Gemmatimonadota bacterium]